MPKIDYNYLFSRQSLRSLDYARDETKYKKLWTPQKGYFVGIP